MVGSLLTADAFPVVDRLYGGGGGGKKLPPIIQSSVKFRNFAEFYSLKTYHFQTWPVY